jgi:hypothetical protein
MHEAYPPDVVILLYDVTDPNSFAFVADIFLVGLLFIKKILNHFSIWN